MTRLFRTAFVATASIGLLASPAMADKDKTSDEAAAEMTKGEKKLAKILEGRVAGEPKSCIFMRPSERMRVIDDTAIVYGRGKTIYVNRTARPDDIDDRDTMVIRRFSSSQLCRQDIVTTIDRASGIFTGTIFLSEFVPYTRIDGDSANGS